MRLSLGYGRLSENVVKLNRSLRGLRQASRQWHNHLGARLKSLRFTQCVASPCMFCLMEEDKVHITLVAHVDYIFAVGCVKRCDRFSGDLNEMVPTKTLGKLRWYSRTY